jgi:hypothetical protein
VGAIDKKSASDRDDILKEDLKLIDVERALYSFGKALYPSLNGVLYITLRLIGSR